MDQDKDDPTNPAHYRSHPSGVECIEVTEHLSFCLGNAIKYIWRADERDEKAVEDLRKAIWYLEREVSRRTRTSLVEVLDAMMDDPVPYAPTEKR